MINTQIRFKLIEALCVLDDAKRFGWSEIDYEKVEAKLIEAISIINANNPN